MRRPARANQKSPTLLFPGTPYGFRVSGDTIRFPAGRHSNSSREIGMASPESSNSSREIGMVSPESRFRFSRRGDPRPSANRARSVPGPNRALSRACLILRTGERVIGAAMPLLQRPDTGLELGSGNGGPTCRFCRSWLCGDLSSHVSGDLMPDVPIVLRQQRRSLWGVGLVVSIPHR